MSLPEQYIPPPERKFAEFSPKKVLLLIQHSLKYLLSKWILILSIGILLGLLMVVIGFSNKPVFTAEITFALDEGAVKSSTNNFSQISEDLGFGPSYEAGGVFSSMTNILELIQSRLLIEKTLKRSVVLYGKPVLFANFFLDSLRYRKKWMKDSPYEHLDFQKIDSSREEELFRNGIINNIYGVITSKLIKIDRKGKGTTLILVSLSSENELFSKYFLEALIEEVSTFYVEMKTHRSKLHVDFIQKRTDSVRGAYMRALLGRADFSDANVNPNLQTNIVPGERKQTDVLVLRETYVNLVKNLESAKTSLMQETPLFQYLDMPILPLKVTGSSPLIKFIFFSIIGIALSSFVLMAIRFYRFLMDRPE